MKPWRHTAWAASLALAACSAYPTVSSKLTHNTGSGQGQVGRPYAAHPNADQLTYYKDIKPLMDEKCTVCHATSGIIFSLEDYRTVFNFKAGIRSALAAGRMPKYLSVDGHQVYQDELRLTNEEYARYMSWLDKGAPQGDIKDYVPGIGKESDLKEGINLPVFTADKPYLPNQKVDDEYRCFIVPSSLAKDSYITAFQAFPGDKAIAHHIIAYRIEKDIVPTLQKLDNEEDGPGYQCFGGALPDRLGDLELQKRLEKDQPGIVDRLNKGNYRVAGWAPGIRKVEFPKGTGVPFKAGDAFVVQMHYYTKSAPGVADSSTSIKFQTIDQAVPGMSHSLTMTDWFQAQKNQSLVVEPHTTPVFKATRTIKSIAQETLDTLGLDAKDYKSIVIHSADVHMHAAGLSGVTYIEDNLQNKEVYLDIADWDLHWQKNFWFDAPKIINLQDADQYSLSIVCQYKNEGSTNIVGGFGSYDEMCINFSYITFSKELAPPAVIPHPENKKPALSVQLSSTEAALGASIDLNLKLETGFSWSKPGESDGLHYHVSFDSEDNSHADAVAWQEKLTVQVPQTLKPGKNHYLRVSLRYADHDPVGVDVRIPITIQ